LDWQDTDESPDAIREVYLQFYRCAWTILKFSLKKPKMQEKHLYEYSVIRVVPRVEREEFLNVGLLFWKAKFIKVIHSLDIQRTSRLQKLMWNKSRWIWVFEKVAHGTKARGPIALIDIPSRFRWLTALRSSVIQTSRPHPGLCDDLEKQPKTVWRYGIVMIEDKLYKTWANST
jgi:hypothetical protein